MSRRRTYIGLLSILALVGVGCSGGSSQEVSSKGPEPSQAEPAAAAQDGSAAATTPAPETPSPSEMPDASAASANPAPTAPSAAPGEPNRTAPGPNKSAPGAAPGVTPPTPGTPAAAPATAGKPSDGPARSTPAAPAAAKPNYASDVGVTADTIRIGTINLTSATRSLGPAIAAVHEQNIDAAVKYINRNGGVSGRKLQLVTCDDGGDIGRARGCYEKLKDNVFAFVPAITWLTDVIHDRLIKDKIPWFTWGWFKSEYEDPWMFPCHANGIREAVAAADWTARVLKPKTAGIMYLNVSEDIAARDVAKKKLEERGIKVVATVAQEWDSPDESQHVLAMRAADPDVVLSFTWPSAVAKFMHDANAQKWKPRLGYIANHMTADPGYGSIFGDYIKDQTYTITSWGVPTAPDPNNPEGATAEQRLLVEELLRTNGREFQGFKWRYAGMHHITQSGWICTRILAKAAAELGPDLTREGLKKLLESKGWDSGLGVKLHWPANDHNAHPYSFNREFIYKWVGAPDGGWDMKRILPDPVFDCGAPNIPPNAKTVCNS